MRISIVIPTLNEEHCLDALLTRLIGAEVIVADGGSRDGTIEIARRRGARVVEAEACRGAQLHSAALAASGDVLWFLHADSLPSPHSLEAIREALSDSCVAGGYFRVCFGESSRAAVFLNRFYAAIRKVGLVYGDAGIFVRRECYDACGGFAPQPLFEDLDFVTRLRTQGRLRSLDCVLVASPRRWARRGFVPTFASWVGLQALYWAGVSPHLLARSYAQVREISTEPRPAADCLRSRKAS